MILGKWNICQVKNVASWSYNTGLVNKIGKSDDHSSAIKMAKKKLGN